MSHHNVKGMIGNKAVLGAVMADGPVEINVYRSNQHRNMV